MSLDHFVSRTLNYSLDKDKIGSQQTLMVISHFASKPEAWRMAWDFVLCNWKFLYKRYCIKHITAGLPVT